VLQRQLAGEKIRFDRSDRAILAALLHQLPRHVLRQVRLLVCPDIVLRWHRDLMAHRHTITRLDIRRRDRLGGVLHEYGRAA
jgi:hypothetical protein